MIASFSLGERLLTRAKARSQRAELLLKQGDFAEAQEDYAKLVRACLSLSVSEHGASDVSLTP